jgi:hypothetical protein
MIVAGDLLRRMRLCTAMIIIGTVSLHSEIQRNGTTTLEFDNQRVRCLFTLKVLTTIPQDSLTPLIFNYSSLKEFSKEVSIIRLLENGEKCYTVEFTIRYLFNEMVSTYQRCRQADSISINMLSFKQSLTFLPSVTATRASFSFAPHGSLTQIEYRQEILLNQPIEWIHYEVIKHKLRGFARDFENFIRKREQRPLPLDPAASNRDN